MSRYGKIFKHINVDDVKKKHHDNIVAEKRRIEEVEDFVTEVEGKESNWRKELSEKMTTSAVMTAFSGDEDGPVELATIDASLEASFQDGPNNALQYMKFKATAIKDSGSGSGNSGGFNIGKHLAFSANTNSDGTAYQSTSSRHAMLAPIDARNMDTLTITAIRGNDSNGGELADAKDEDLRINWYADNAELWNGGGWAEKGRWQSLKYDYDGNYHSDVEDIIIPRVPGDSGSYDGEFPGLRDWSIEIPEWCRRENVRFMLYQMKHSGHGYDHYGITQIKYQRRTPQNVVVPLDDPAASSFIRLGQGSAISSPKKRKKKVEDMLIASREYTDTKFGAEFPGSGSVFGDVIKGSPIGKDQVKKAFSDADPSVASDTPNMLAKDSKTAQELISDLKIPDRNDFNYKQVGKYDSKGYEKAVTEYHNKVFDIIMEKHDPLNNPNFMVNTDYTPNDTQLKRMRVYENIKDTSRAVRQSKYMYQSPNTGYIDVMTGKTTQYQPPIDVKSGAGTDYHDKLYPGSREPSKGDFRGIPPSFYWSAPITDAIAFLYQRGPEGLVYKNVKDIGNPDKGQDPKKFLKALMRKTNSLRTGQPPLSPLELVNYHRQFSKGSSRSPTGTYRPGEARYQRYVTRIKEAFSENGLTPYNSIPEDEYSSTPPSEDFTKLTGKERWRYRMATRAKSDLVDFEQSEKEYKRIFDKQRKEGRHKKGDWYGYKITSKDKRGLTKTAIEKKPRTYGNDREYRWRKVQYRAAAFGVGGGSKIGKMAKFEHLEYPQSWLKEMGLAYVLDGGEVLQETTYDKIKKVRKNWDYKDKPASKGEPKDPPPELDPKTGMHPQHGQHAARYKKLDPQSAESMPPTGNPEIDATVDKQRDKDERARKVKNIVGHMKKTKK